MLENLKYSTRKLRNIPRNSRIHKYKEKKINLYAAFLCKSGKVTKKEIQKNNQFRMTKTKPYTEEMKYCTEGRNFKVYKRMKRASMFMDWPN